MIGYRCDARQGVTFTVWDGDVSFYEATAHLVRLAGDPTWPPGPLHLTDLTTAGNIQGATDAELLAELVEGHEPFRMAIVARDATPGAAMIERSAKEIGSVVSVHEDLDEACAWLVIESAEARATLVEIRRELRA